MSKKLHKNCIAVVARPMYSQVGEIYPSLTSCAKALNCQVSHISEVAGGIRPCHKGYIFTYLYCNGRRAK